MGPGGLLLHGHPSGFSVAPLSGAVYPLRGAVWAFHCLQAPNVYLCTPLYLFFALKRRRFGMLGLGVLLAVGTLLLTALPFTQDFNFLWLLERYQSTLDYYSFYSVNAYNFWSLIGWNWKALPAGLAGDALDLLGAVIATVLCGVWVFRAKSRAVVFYCPALLMAAMYAFSVKMHERYLFPALLFLLLSFVFTQDKGMLRAFALCAVAHYANVAYVLWQFREYYNSYNPNTGLTLALSALQLAALGYAVWVGVPGVPAGGAVRPGEVPRARTPAGPFRRGQPLLQAGLGRSSADDVGLRLLCLLPFGGYPDGPDLLDTPAGRKCGAGGRRGVRHPHLPAEHCPGQRPLRRPGGGEYPSGDQPGRGDLDRLRHPHRRQRLRLEAVPALYPGAMCGSPPWTAASP